MAKRRGDNGGPELAPGGPLIPPIAKVALVLAFTATGGAVMHVNKEVLEEFNSETIDSILELLSSATRY